MADNIELNAGTGGAILAADDVSTVWYQQCKLVDGTLGATTPIAAGAGTAAGGLRTTLASDDPAVVSLAAAAASLATLDNAISGAGINVTQIGTAAAPIGAGVEATAVRVTLPTDGTGVVKLGAGTAEIGKLAAGTAEIGNVKNSGTFAVQAAATVADAANVVEGATTGAAVITDANGTIQQYLRGLVKLAITAGGWLVTATLAAGTALIGRVSASLETGTIYSGTTALTPKFVNIDTATSGNVELVAAVASRTLRVLSLSLFATAAVDVYFNDGTANIFGGTRKVKLDNTGAVGAGGFVHGFNPVGWFQTAAQNRPININLSAAIGVCGTLVYVEVP